MIALKLVFQSLAGVAAVGSVASGGYYMFNISEDQYFLVSSTVATNDVASEDNFFTNTTTKTPVVSASSLFLNTVADGSSASVGTGSGASGTATHTPTPENRTTQTGTSEQTAQETSTTNPLQELTKQNYTCKNTEKKTEDSECKLFTIKFDNTNKSIDLTAINKFIKEQTNGIKNTDKITKTLNKSELTSKHFFILKSSTSLITRKMVEDKKTITLSSTATDGNDKNKSYATLTLLARFSEEKLIGKTNLGVVKATSVDDNNKTLTIPSEPQKTYTFTLQNVEKTELKGCSIQVLDSYSDSTPFNFSTTTLSTTQAALTITKDKHYLIKWTEAQKLSSLKNKIHFSVQPTQPATQGETTTTKTEPTFTELSFISHIFAHPTATTFTEVIIVK